MNDKKWHSNYDFNRTGAKCQYSRLPEKLETSNTWVEDFDTEEEAWENYREGLKYHVNFLIDRIKETAFNNALEKRLEKYYPQGLQLLKECQQIVSTIPTI